jgi:hypothetical protein
MCIDWVQGSPAVEQLMHPYQPSLPGLIVCFCVWSCLCVPVCSAHRAALLELCIGWAQGSPAVEQLMHPYQPFLCPMSLSVSDFCPVYVCLCAVRTEQRYGIMHWLGARQPCC